jgi:hypothetical protein
VSAGTTFATKADARAWLASVETDLNRGEHLDPVHLEEALQDLLGVEVDVVSTGASPTASTGPHPPALEVAQQVGPRLGGLPVAVGDRHQLLGAVDAEPTMTRQHSRSSSRRT